MKRDTTLKCSFRENIMKINFNELCIFCYSYILHVYLAISYQNIIEGFIIKGLIMRV